MEARRSLPRDPAGVLLSVAPIAILAAAAVVPGGRWLAVAGLVAGTAIAVGRAAPVRWAWAAAVPVAVGLAWQAWQGGRFAPGGLDCTNPASPFAVARLAEAGLAIGALAALAILLGSSRASVGLVLPGRRYRGAALGGFLLVGPAALLVGPFVATPFFGHVAYDVRPGAIVPALLFALANGTMEELAYRGALMSWSARVIGAGPALFGQALVFGLAHSGSDVVGAPVVLMLGVGLGGLLAGIIALRTRSLLVPIAIHVGFDLPIYFAWACASS